MPHYGPSLKEILVNRGTPSFQDFNRLKKPEEFLNDIFHTSSIRSYLRHVLTYLYSRLDRHDLDKVIDVFLSNFLSTEREVFVGNLKNYVEQIVDSQKAKLGKPRKDNIGYEDIPDSYIEDTVDYLIMFLRNQIFLQKDFEIPIEFDLRLKYNEIGYYFLDQAFHKFSIGKIFAFTGYLESIDEEGDEIYGVQKGLLRFEDISDKSYDFDIETKSFRKFRRRLEAVINDRILFTIKILDVYSEKHCYVRLLDLID